MSRFHCPLCDSISTIRFVVADYPILDCEICGHRFSPYISGSSNIMDVYGDEYFTGGGAGYPDYAAESIRLVRRGRGYARKLKTFLKTGRLLDIGAANGSILQGFIEEGWRGIGLEPNATMAASGKAEYGLDIQTGDLESFDSVERFELITMIQVVAHFHDPKTAFKNAKRILDRNGHLLIETWDRDSITAKVLGKHWHEYSPPSVLHWFSRRSLKDFLGNEGFDEVYSGRTLKSISGTHAKSLLKYRLGDLQLLRLMPDRISFPYPSEDLFWALYRKR